MNTADLGITIKSVDERKRTVRGIASTGSLDRMGDVVEPLGATWRGVDLPFMVAHNHNLVVGRVKFDKPTKDGIGFEAHLPEIAEPGPLRDRVETAYGELRYGLIKSVSIGFRPDADHVEQLPGGGLRFLKFEIIELSMCAVGAQQDAEILEVRNGQHARNRGVVRLDSRPAERPFQVVKLTKKEMLIAKWKGEAERRAAARARLGIPEPVRVVKLEARHIVNAQLTADKERREARAKKPFRIVKINRTR